MALLKKDPGGCTIILSEKDFPGKAAPVKNLETQFYKFIKGAKNKTGSELGEKIREYAFQLSLILKNTETSAKINVSGMAAKKLFLLGHYISAFDKIAQKYGIQKELDELKALKHKFRILLSKSLKTTMRLSFFAQKMNQNYRLLLKSVENQGAEYNGKKSGTIAVKRCFILANEFKKILGLDKRFDISRETLIGEYEGICREILSYPEDYLDRLIVDNNRLYRFNAARWYIETINIKDVGVWPRMGGLDDFTTCGNLPDTTDKIYDRINNTRKYKWPIKPILPGSKIDKFVSIRRHVDTIYRLFPIILTARGQDTIRSRRDKKHRKNISYRYEVTPFDIEDGNHRAVSFAMFGIRKLRCFVGRGLLKDSPG